MKKVIIKVGGMSCSACQNRVEKYLNKQDGVEASVNLVMAQALIHYDEDKVTMADIARFIKESGYTYLGVYDNKLANKKDYSFNYIILFAVLVLILMYISMGSMIHLPIPSIFSMHEHPIIHGITILILTIPFLIYGFDIIKSGLLKLIHRSPNMDSLVTVGVLTSFIYSLVNLIIMLVTKKDVYLYFESVAMIIYFMKLGRFLDKRSKDKTKEAIEELVTITPETAILKTETGEKEVTIDTVKIGDILICKAGDKVAVDGTIVAGETHVDEAFITGESEKKKKREKDRVLAGTLVIDGYIEYKAEAIGPDSTISEIVRLVMESVNTKAPIARVADKVSSIFVPIIFIIAFVSFITYLIITKNFNEAIETFVTILVVACPCALGLATPLALVTSCGKAASEGILIKTSETLEKAHQVDTIVFDKTGTLTYGNLRVARLNNYSDYTNDELITLIASLEHKSTHPIASAFKTYKDEHKLKLKKVEKFSTISNLGIAGTINDKKIYLGSSKILEKLELYNKYKKEELALAKEGNSIVYVIENKKVIALIGVQDVIRVEAAKAIEKLKALGKEVVMLSGDNKETANRIAKSLGIDEVIADQLPQDKERFLKDLKKSNKQIMMIGDGINDAPSLSSSDIGLSLNSGTDIAANSSDIILMNNNLLKIVDLINISKKTITIIKENLFWAFFYNVLMIPIAIGILKPIGISITPVIAAIAMTISSLTVVLNSLRLRK